MTTGPSSSTSLHASNNLIPWPGGARYTVALGSLLAIGGRLAERLGRRKCTAAGMSSTVIHS